MKQCSKCKSNKPLSEYHLNKQNKDGLNSYCKDCKKKYMRKNYQSKKQQAKQYYQDNKVKIQKYYQDNKESKRQYDKDNKIRINKNIKRWMKEKYHKDELFKLKTIVASRVNQHLKGKIKSKSTIEHLGCDIQFYKEYLTGMFDVNMSWDNYGSYWEIDHINPLSKGGTLHYSNTQPLSVKENRRKSAKNLDTRASIRIFIE